MTVIKPSILDMPIRYNDLQEAKMVMKRYMDFNCDAYYRPNENVSNIIFAVLSQTLAAMDDLK